MRLRVSHEGFRTPSVRRGRILPSCTVTCVLLSASGPEEKPGVSFSDKQTVKIDFSPQRCYHIITNFDEISNKLTGGVG